MNYIKASFFITPNEEYLRDILSDSLGELPFESFQDTNNGIDAFCPKDAFNLDALKILVNRFPFDADIKFSTEEIQDEDWNKEWEQSGNTPIVIDEQCIICASKAQRDNADAQYKIIIDPKMSFGTGHHQTTRLMASEILQLDFEHKSLLDMGCGTAVLAILAAMKGATRIEGIDIDKWAYDNALLNIKTNHCEQIKIRLGSAETLKDKHFDFIFANINRNILLNDMHAYADCLKQEGELFISGFYLSDATILEEKAKTFGLEKMYSKSNEDWTMIRFKKIN